MNRGSGDEAIAEYRTAIRIQPITPARNLGSFLSRQEIDRGDRRVPHRHPDQPDDASDSLGGVLCRWRSREYAAAAAEFREAIRLRPDSANAHVGLGSTCARHGRRSPSTAQPSTSSPTMPAPTPTWAGPSNCEKRDEAIADAAPDIHIQPGLRTSRLGTLAKPPDIGSRERSEGGTELAGPWRSGPGDGTFHNTLAWPSTAPATGPVDRRRRAVIALAKGVDASTGSSWPMAAGRERPGPVVLRQSGRLDQERT